MQQAERFGDLESRVVRPEAAQKADELAPGRQYT
jgi:hypothetical protein